MRLLFLIRGGSGPRLKVFIITRCHFSIVLGRAFVGKDKEGWCFNSTRLPWLCILLEVDAETSHVQMLSTRKQTNGHETQSAGPTGRGQLLGSEIDDTHVKMRQSCLTVFQRCLESSVVKVLNSLSVVPSTE